MACSPDFVQYIIDQCSDAGEIAVKKMMGDPNLPIGRFRAQNKALSCPNGRSNI